MSETSAIGEVEVPDTQEQKKEAAPSLSPDLVTAVMCVSNEKRLNLCRTTVNLTMQQSYRRIEIVIVNTCGREVTNREHPAVKEFQLEPVGYPTLGSMRNFGIEQARGDWILPLDDDDHHHQHRIALQMAHRRPGCCVALTQQIRVDTENSIVCFHENQDGIPGSILFPKVSEKGEVHQYDAGITGPGEDTELYNRCFGKNRVVLSNDITWFPGPAMQIAFWHGLNLTPRETFMAPYDDVEKWKGVRPDDMDDDMVAYLRSAMSLYGLELGESGGDAEQ